MQYYKWTSNLLITMLQACTLATTSQGLSPCQHGIRAVFSHKSRDGKQMSRSNCFKTNVFLAEKNYSRIEKETLAIILALKKIHGMVHSKEFVLQTDHKPVGGHIIW